MYPYSAARSTASCRLTAIIFNTPGVRIPDGDRTLRRTRERLGGGDGPTARRGPTRARGPDGPDRGWLPLRLPGGPRPCFARDGAPIVRGRGRASGASRGADPRPTPARDHRGGRPPRRDGGRGEPLSRTRPSARTRGLPRTRTEGSRRPAPPLVAERAPAGRRDEPGPDLVGLGRSGTRPELLPSSRFPQAGVLARTDRN